MRRMTQEEWERCVDSAAHADISLLAPDLGFSLVQCGRGYRHRDFDSLKINGHLWKRWSGKTGMLGKYVQGTTVQLVQEYAGLSFRDAVLRILEITEPALYVAAGEGRTRRSLTQRVSGARIAAASQSAAQEEPSHIPFHLPARSRYAERVFDYLTHERGIAPDIVRRELKEGRLYQDTRQNCVFVGRDDSGSPAFACIRGTDRNHPYKMDCRGSQKAYSWRAVPERGAQSAFVFESPIEALSYMSILMRSGRDWQRSAYISLGGVGGAALFNYLERADSTENVYLCLNNDEAGRTGAERIARQIGPSARLLLPGRDGQDWNDVLRTDGPCVAKCGRAKEEEISR